jgi:hypothetical protein
VYYTVAQQRTSTALLVIVSLALAGCLALGGFLWRAHERLDAAHARVELLERQDARTTAERDALRRQLDVQNEAVRTLAEAARRLERLASDAAARELQAGQTRLDTVLTEPAGPARMQRAFADLFEGGS